ncbi:domain found in IF2B/IF5-domain-containing protein [Pseudomassariella vexata]|uniref:Domain found in IF2B/IF5-domain-containing protein n=1 Tax=Pseudomassariella vexata TaxID=1141098 RepID=A0A1Y2EET2_9PEZI|nr:domain found in IF2B/IF5-domain-containing protein [Pseudomassariella vexata]ORY70070.1 domain found in IF2B/IF5-domain-containing protein [Pseudomassariella vexata]
MVELLAVNPKKGDDKFYRYKMQRVMVKVEGKGNGIKTVVVNLSNIAASLARPGSYVIKWFGLDLGAQTNIDPPDDRWIINGAHEAEVLQKSLFTFIEKYVLCDDCGNPETDISIKDDVIRKDCKACGARSRPLPHTNLTNFMIKTQPKKGKKNKSTKAERQAARVAKQRGLQNGKENGSGSGGDDNSENGSNENGNNDDDDNDVGSDDEFTKFKADAQVYDASKDIKDDDWAVDMSEKAVKARQNQLPSEFRQRLVLEGGEEDEEGEGGGSTAYDALGEWVLEQAEKEGIDKVDDLEVYKKAKELGIEAKYKTVLVLVQTLFNENIATQIPKRASLFKQVAGKNSERHEKALLGGLERLLASKGKEHPKLMTPDTISNKILYQLYEKDLITEDIVKKWGSKASKKYCDLAISREIRRSAEVFIKWLDEAESEEETDDE